jgi:hypothetical protein
MIRTGLDTQDRDERLNEVLLAYLEAAEPGAAPDRRRFLAQHPEFAAELADFFACRDRVEGIIAPLRGAGGTNAPRAESSDFGAHPDGDGAAASTRQVAGLTPAPGAGAGPRLLGDFRLLREVGRGGMGIVYEAEQVSLGRRVALKVRPLAAGMDSRQLQRFKNEAQAAALLHYPNVVPVYAVGCERETHYYAMQFIEGPSLAAWAEGLRRPRQGRPAEPSPSRGEPFVRSIAELGWKAGAALEYAHQQGIVHRDIRPGNLLLDGRGEP